MKNRAIAILAAIGATAIYSLNHTVAKGVMPNFVQPFGFIMLRVMGAAFLFWTVSPWGPKEHIEKKDYLRLLLCAVLGMGFNMLSFFKGLSLSTPINSSVINTVSPIFVLILSALLIKEKIGGIKVFGVVIGLLGAMGLIFFGNELRQDAPNIPLGNFLILMNALFYGAYLIVVKTLLAKYHPFTFMKWLFSLGILICLPFGYTELMAIKWQVMPFEAIWRIVFVVYGTTFLAYLLNIFALTQLRASTVSTFIYLQPLIGTLFAVAMGSDSLTAVKVFSALLVLVGVYFASKRPKPNVPEA